MPKNAVAPKVVFEPGQEAVAVATELAKEETLKTAGISLLVDSSGKLLSQRRACTRKDVIANARVIAAAVRGTPRSRKRLSSYVYMDAILYYFNNHDVLPRGISIATEAVRDYACRAGSALRRLVTKFKPLLRRARTSRNSTLMSLKTELKDYLPSKDSDATEDTSSESSDDEDADSQLQELAKKPPVPTRALQTMDAPPAQMKPSHLETIAARILREDPQRPEPKLQNLVEKVKSSGGMKAGGDALQSSSSSALPSKVMDSLESVMNVKTRVIVPSEQWCQESEHGHEDDAEQPKKKMKKKTKRLIGKKTKAGVSKPASKTEPGDSMPASKSEPGVTKPASKSEPCVSKPAAKSECLYKAGEFREIRLKFIADLRASEDVTFSEACKRWNTSERRNKLLEGMSYAQLKKRRFI